MDEQKNDFPEVQPLNAALGIVINRGTDRKGAYLRAFLIICLAVLPFLLADADFVKNVPWWVKTGLGAVGVAFGTWRGFLDQSLTSARQQEAHQEANNQ